MLVHYIIIGKWSIPEIPLEGSSVVQGSKPSTLAWTLVVCLSSPDSGYPPLHKGPSPWWQLPTLLRSLQPVLKYFSSGCWTFPTCLTKMYAP